jgi:hypothetical protein
LIQRVDAGSSRSTVMTGMPCLFLVVLIFSGVGWTFFETSPRGWWTVFISGPSRPSRIPCGIASGETGTTGSPVG